MEASRWLKNNHVKTFYGGNWNALAAIISIFLSITTSIVLAARLPQEIFGLYKYVYTIIGFFSAFTLSGIQNALLHGAARGKTNIVSAAQTIYMRHAWPFMACITLYGGYSLYAGEGIIFTGTLFVAGVGFIATNILTMYGSVLSGKELYKTGAKINIIIGIFQAIATICTALLTQNIITITALSIVFTLLPAFYFNHTLRECYGTEYNSEDITAIEKESKLFTGTNMVAALSNYGDKLIIFNILGSTTLAAYALADDIVTFGKGIVKSYASTHVPRMVRGKIYKKVFFKTLAQSIICGIILFGAYFAIAPHIFKYFYGAYANAGRYTAILSATLIFITPITYMAYLLQSWQMIRAIYISTVTTHGMRVLGYSLGVFYFGVNGVIAAHIITYAVSMLVSIMLIKKSGYLKK